MPSIKVDLGVEPLAGGVAGESWHTCLKAVTDRASRFYDRCPRFAKWRVVLLINSSDANTELVVRGNAFGWAMHHSCM